MKDAVLLTRYPYTAAVIAIIWLGVAIVAIVRGDVVLEIVLGLLALATLIVAAVGFSAPKR